MNIKNRFLFLILPLMSLILFHCKNQKIELDFCKIVELDQSFVSKDKSNMAKFESDRRNRRKLFKKNFEELIVLAKGSGFPNADLINEPKDTCISYAITLTLIHIAQSKPDLLFNKETIDLLGKELENGNLNSRDLAPAYQMSIMTTEFCNALKDKIEYASEVWGFDKKLIGKAKFKNCSK